MNTTANVTVSEGAPHFLPRAAIACTATHTSGTYVHDVCTLSYRWCTAEDPDPDGEQLAAALQFEMVNGAYRGFGLTALGLKRAEVVLSHQGLGRPVHERRIQISQAPAVLPAVQPAVHNQVRSSTK